MEETDVGGALKRKRLRTLRAASIAVLAVVRERSRRRVRTMAQWAVVLGLFDDDGTKDDVEPSEKRSRRVRERKDWRTSAWWIQLQDTDLEDYRTDAAKVFRGRFRVPYPFFVELVKLAKEKKWFSRGQVDALGREGIPLELKILAALYVLGRGSCFEDISELSLMSTSMAAATFHSFCKKFAEELYEEHVYLPTGEYQEKVMDEYHKLGFTGAIGSTDVTHIGWGTSPSTLGRSSPGKEGVPTITFQVTVDRAGRALAVTKGFTGATDDQTIIRYDAAVAKIGTDPQYKDREYKLRQADGTFRTRRGCYLIVDNGSHEWVTLIAPSKAAEGKDETAFSRTAESVLKDVKCFFGILKGRFRVLKLRMGYHSQESIDNIFFTCCILHNMLHAFDGMDEFEENVDWAGRAGVHNAWENDPLIDHTSVGPRKDGRGGGGTNTVERHPEHAELKRQLIESFAYRKKHDDIIWLSR